MSTQLYILVHVLIQTIRLVFLLCCGNSFWVILYLFYNSIWWIFYSLPMLITILKISSLLNTAIRIIADISTRYFTLAIISLFENLSIFKKIGMFSVQFSHPHRFLSPDVPIFIKFHTYSISIAIYKEFFVFQSSISIMLNTYPIL